MRKSARLIGWIIVALLVLLAVVWQAIASEYRGGALAVSFLDVGQGDSIFIDAPSGRQVLIDGGPDSSVLRKLSREMPWYDRTIDVVVATHPDLDHIGGLIDVLSRYDVSTVVRSSAEGNTAAAEELARAIPREGARSLVARRGQIIDLGSGAYLEILSPDRDLSRADTNVGCVVARLSYGNTSFMFSCDAPQAMEEYVASLDGAALKSDVLKAGHHGSRTSSSALFVGFVNPSYAVISRGCDNRYGHPHREVIELFEKFGIPIADTCIDGTITFISDGNTVVRK